MFEFVICVASDQATLVYGNILSRPLFPGIPFFTAASQNPSYPSLRPAAYLAEDPTATPYRSSRAAASYYDCVLFAWRTDNEE